MMRAAFASFFLASSLVEGAVTHRRDDSPWLRYTSSGASDGTTFTLRQIENQNFTGHDGPMAFMRAHMKYAQKLPDDVKEALEANSDLRLKLKTLGQSARQQGNVASSPSPGIDSEYSIEVQLGTPPQTIPLNLDTGSSDLWTLSTDTTPSMVRGQAIYKPADSSTSQRLDGEKWHVKYGDDASAEGIVYTDKVQIGTTYVDHQAVETAEHVSQDISADTFVSGILGMANSAANMVRPHRQKTYIDNIRDQLAEPLFTANLQAGKPGSYGFGYINETEYTGDIHYTKVDLYTPFWKIAGTGYKVGDEEHKSRIDAIVDTGTSLLLLPTPVVVNYWDKVAGARQDPQLGMVVFPCAQQLPDFYFGIDKYYGKVPGQFMNYGRVNEQYCFGGIQTSDGLPFSVLGDVLLKAQYVVFNYRDPAVGFANKPLDL